MSAVTYENLTLENGLYLDEKTLSEFWDTHVSRNMNWGDRVQYAQTMLELRAIELEMEQADEKANIINALQGFRRIEAFCFIDKPYFDRRRATPMSDAEYLTFMLDAYKKTQH